MRCSAPARAAMPTICRHRIPKASAPGCDARGAAVPELAASEIDYLNMHATATPETTRWKAVRLPAFFLTGWRAVEPSRSPATPLVRRGPPNWPCAGWPCVPGSCLPHCWDGVADPALPALSLVASGQTFARAAGAFA